jgi:hypothetical protein
MEEIGILLTACRENETAADARPSGDAKDAHGAFTAALCSEVASKMEASGGQPPTCREVVLAVRQKLQQQGFRQNPCLECSDQNADRLFLAV